MNAVKQIIHAILIFAEGYIKVANETQQALAARQIFALGILVGGCIAGATTPEQVEANVRAVEWRLTPDELADLDHALGDVSVA